MAAIEMTFNGVIYDKQWRTARPVVFIGEASFTGLGVGGGPIYPPEGGGPGQQPPGFWGPTDPFPTPPIANVPGAPGYRPPNRPPDPILPHPEHPIVLPPDRPVDPPTEPPTNPSDPQWHWCWNPQTGWIPAYVAPDKPQPPPIGGPAKK